MGEVDDSEKVQMLLLGVGGARFPPRDGNLQGDHLKCQESLLVPQVFSVCAA